MQKLENLKDLRKKLGFSVEECGKVIGVSASTYRDYENDPKRFTVDKAIILATYLGKHPSEIDWLGINNEMSR